MERFDKACKYTQAKILGTLVCLVGAMAMSFLQRPPSSAASDLQASLATSSELQGSSYYDWILGCSYLFVAVIVLSFYTVLQVINNHWLVATINSISFTLLLPTTYGV